ncbi:MAG: bifunctional diaminohydroxyphosphoribosylaminopyrimidine deaminase/5-amino-6-(5-phosphoribosylamino)uracil reductase RibD [Candidatus Sericytochromatia bacterium]|nr:bifunctional diaminohydroxyphosphoribosylaminopyrimidine deaminase/5-amino-6-(5-phosphoribosylamino)uracil reductase RibD [Candidatus Sericytochromatia bacterium]
MIEQDTFFMKKAIELAKQGRGRTGLHSMSGALVVNNGEIVGEGFYSLSGSEHAEYYALKAAGEKAQGATLYVVVEPCTNKGKYTSCCKFIKDKGIKRVVVATEDPNSSVKGKGIACINQTDMELTFGVEQEAATVLNETLIKYYAIRLPFVNMVNAMTLDGKISTVIGDREWIFCNESRNYLHELRSQYDAVIVGVNTVILDNPQLNCKSIGGKDPVKIVLDSYGKTPANSKIFIKSVRDDHKPNVIIAVSSHATEERIKSLTAAGAEVLVCADEKNDDSPYGKVNLKKLIYLLGKKGFTSVLLEGGGNLNASAIKEDIVDKITVFITPKIVGGKDAMTPVEGNGISLMSEAIELKSYTCNKIGNDLLVEGYF